MEKLNLHVEPQGDIIIREGKAPQVSEPEKISISGTIQSIGEFLIKRGEHKGLSSQRVDPCKTIVIVDRKKRSIQLLLDPEHPKGLELSGQLELSDELEPFHINKQTTFGRKELVKLLRFNRMLFSDSEQHASLIAAYSAFKAKTQGDIDAEEDQRGNKKFGYQKKVETNIPDTFIMDAPIFKGHENRKFLVQICLDVTDGGGAQFWFESVELKELIDKEAEEIIDDQLKHCADFPIIEK